MASDRPEAIYWGGHDEAYLATFQKHQGVENNSGAYAVAAAFSLLRGGRKVDYDQVAAASNRWTVLHAGLLAGVPGLIFGRSRRLWPGGPMTPQQQAGLATWLGRSRGFRVKAQVLKRATVQDLLSGLAQADSLALVTLGWDNRSRPLIIHPDGTLMAFPPVGSLAGSVEYPCEALVMVVVAFDPGRIGSAEGRTFATPWGLLGWWADGHLSDAAGYGHLHWMPDADFRAAWGYRLPLIGSHGLVHISVHR